MNYVILAALAFATGCTATAVTPRAKQPVDLSSIQRVCDPVTGSMLYVSEQGLAVVADAAQCRDKTVATTPKPAK
jgi:hypothetical protein